MSLYVSPAKSPKNARHLSLSVDHYTPRKYIEAARSVMGGIDLDVASSALANETVRAERFFTKDDNALRRACEWHGSVWCNPPGGKDGGESVAKAFWFKLVDQWDRGHTTCAVFLGFSLEILQTSQIEAPGPVPLDFPFCVPRERIAFWHPTGADASLRQAALLPEEVDELPLGVVEGTDPTHANVIALLPPIDARDGAEMTEAFVRTFSRFGKVRV